ncbi:MAG: hypothetical protein IBJ09_01585 [Bacteroidia bacterium]|nr:hypothetical protein [Bacteroidia bacterium]
MILKDSLHSEPREFSYTITAETCKSAIIPAVDYLVKINSDRKENFETVYDLTLTPRLGQITNCEVPYTSDSGRVVFSIEKGIYFYKYKHGKGCLKLPWEYVK